MTIEFLNKGFQTETGVGVFFYNKNGKNISERVIFLGNKNKFYLFIS